MPDLKQVVAAFEQQDYPTAARLLKELLKQSPKNPWVQLYVGQLNEFTHKTEAAITIYRQLLRHTISPKVALKARQGLQRIEDAAEAQRRQAIAAAKSSPEDLELGFLILEPVSPEARQAAAKAFARIMKVDPYTSRLTLPSRGWQLYRTGAIGELRHYGQALQQVDIPAFWATLAKIQAIQVLQVSYFQALTPQATIVCLNEQGQQGHLTFEWSEVSQRVQGLLPVFEQVLDQGPWGKLKRKEATNDYVQMCDLHLPERGCLLRFCDRTYQFQNGLKFEPASGSVSAGQTTNRLNWNQFVSFLDRQVPRAAIWSNFTGFAQTTIDHLPALNRLTSHIDLFRGTKTHWDPAFQLYSSLVFLKHLSGSSHDA